MKNGIIVLLSILCVTAIVLWQSQKTGGSVMASKKEDTKTAHQKGFQEGVAIGSVAEIYERQKRLEMVENQCVSLLESGTAPSREAQKLLAIAVVACFDQLSLSTEGDCVSLSSDLNNGKATRDDVIMLYRMVYAKYTEILAEFERRGRHLEGLSSASNLHQGTPNTAKEGGRPYEALENLARARRKKFEKILRNEEESLQAPLDSGR